MDSVDDQPNTFQLLPLQFCIQILFVSASLPDLLTEKQVCAILGYRPKQILDWKHSGKLIALKCFNKTYFPKIPLMDFVSSEDYYNLPCKGRKHIELLRRVQK